MDLSRPIPSSCRQDGGRAFAALMNGTGIAEMRASDGPIVVGFLCGLTRESRQRRFHGWVGDETIRTVYAALDPQRYAGLGYFEDGRLVALLELHFEEASGAGVELALSVSDIGSRPGLHGALLKAGLRLARERGASILTCFWHPGETWIATSLQAEGATIAIEDRCARLDLGPSRSPSDLRTVGGLS